MTNHTINANDYSELLRVLQTTDPAHADTFNPLFERLINNDAFIKALVEKMIKEHTHSGAEDDGAKIPFANIEVPQEMGSIVTATQLQNHINTRNPHGTRASDVGAATAEDLVNLSQTVTTNQQSFTEHLAEIATPTKLGHIKAETDEEGNLIAPSPFVVGTYTGNGSSSRFISLGFTPKAVQIKNNRGYDNFYETGGTIAYMWYGGLAVAGSPVVNNGGNVISVEPNGFNVHNRQNPIAGPERAQTNVSGEVYHYIAFK